MIEDLPIFGDSRPKSRQAVGQPIQDEDELLPPVNAEVGDLAQEVGGVDAEEVDPFLFRKLDGGCCHIWRQKYFC